MKTKDPTEVFRICPDGTTVGEVDEALQHVTDVHWRGVLLAIKRLQDERGEARRILDEYIRSDFDGDCGWIQRTREDAANLLGYLIDKHGDLVDSEEDEG